MQATSPGRRALGVLLWRGDYHDRAVGMVGAVVTDRAEQHPQQAAMSATAHDEEVGRFSWPLTLLHAATVESLSTGIGEFLTSDVLRLHALRSLTQTGMPPELIRARPGGVELPGANAQSLGIAASLSENEEDWLSLLRLLIAPQSLDGVIVFLNPAAAARTNSHLTGLLQTQTGRTFVGYSQFDVMSGAELGVHAARRAALRRRIRDL